MRKRTFPTEGRNESSEEANQSSEEIAVSSVAILHFFGRKSEHPPTPPPLFVKFPKRSSLENGKLTASRKEEEDASLISVAPSSY